MKKRYRALIIGIGLSLLFLMFHEKANLCFPTILEVCVKSLIPSLFPFMIASELIVKSMSNESKFSKYIIFTLGVLFGFPIGASCGSRLFSKGKIGKRDYVRLASCGGIPGIGFFFGTIQEYFGFINTIAIYMCVLTSAILLFIITPGNSLKEIQQYENEINEPLFSVVSSAIKKSVERMVIICGYVSFFYALAGIITSFSDNVFFKILITGLLEFSGGTVECGRIGGGIGFILSAFILAFSGFSVFMQCVTVEIGNGAEPIINEYLLIRCAMGFTAVFLAHVWLVFMSIKILATICILLVFILLCISMLLQRIYRNRLKNSNKCGIITSLH